MANGFRSTSKLIGLALAVIGAGLAFWGYQQSGSVSAQMTEAFTGSASDKVMTLYIAGAASLAVGLYLLIKR